MEAAKIDSPRGPFALSKAHNPIQDIYLRKVEGKENKVRRRRGQGPGRSGRAAASSVMTSLALA